MDLNYIDNNLEKEAIKDINSQKKKVRINIYLLIASSIALSKIIIDLFIFKKPNSFLDTSLIIFLIFSSNLLVKNNIKYRFKINYLKCFLNMKEI